MPRTTASRFGDVVLVPFPFTDQTGTKKRPAVIVSSDAYNQKRRDLVIMAVTSRVRSSPAFAEVMIADWKKAGLLLPSVTKPILSTIERRLVIRRLGKLPASDLAALRGALRLIVG